MSAVYDAEYLSTFYDVYGGKRVASASQYAC